MRPKLNPDGAKIRALRIQRGWTQEQLAEIAGVSARTIQRAETAGCAAFDTLRAVAGAFDTDFNWLLKPDSRQVSDPASHRVPPPDAAAATIPETLGTAYFSRPAHSVRSTSTTIPAVAAALIVGLLTGGTLVYRFYMPAVLHFSTPRTNPAVAAEARHSQESRRHVAGIIQARNMLRTISSPVTVAPIRNRGPKRAAERPRYQDSAAATEAIQSADLDSQTTVSASILPASLDLPLTSNLVPILATVDVPGRWNPAFVHPGDFTQMDPGYGAVRQAIGQVTGKTTGAIAKVGASMKRVF